MLKTDSGKSHLLIDGRNMMYRAIFSNRPQRGRKYHHFTNMMRLINNLVEEFKPKSVNIFWDSKKSTLWRRKLYPGYKDRDMSKYQYDISDDLIKTESAAKALFKAMGVRQFSKKKEEADDLLYSACKILAPQSVIVASTDKDMHQLPFRMQHVILYDHIKGNIVKPVEYDPVIAKALEGDKADTIDGYCGIGPVKASKMAQDMDLRNKFLADNGMKLFLRNMLLVDLSLNPNALANEIYVSNKLCSKPKFDRKLIDEGARKHKVTGLMSDFSRIVLPLKLIIESEK